MSVQVKSFPSKLSCYLIGFSSNIEEYDPTLFTICLKETRFVYFFVAIEVVQELVLL